MSGNTNICYGCADINRGALGQRTSGRVNESVFVDSRTGRGFCAECVMALVSWELDGCPDPRRVPLPRVDRSGVMWRCLRWFKPWPVATITGK